MRRGGEHREQDREDELLELHPDEELAPVEHVGEHAAERGEEEQRPELGEEDEPDVDRDRAVRSSANAPSSTFCIHVPMFDAKVPPQTIRKSRWRSAAIAVPAPERLVAVDQRVRRVLGAGDRDRDGRA